MSLNPKISAYVPGFNNRATLAMALRSIQEQSVPVAELFYVDDGSTDDSAAIAEQLGVRVLRQTANLGRGAARARAMQAAIGELVLCCDATKSLEADFVKQAQPWLADVKVVAVYGRMNQPPARTTAERWRGRHLFRLDEPFAVDRRASLITTGALVRREVVLELGNYDDKLRHSEDADLGARLLAAGHEVVFDPRIKIWEHARNTPGQVLERYWRYNAGKDEAHSWRGYLRLIAYAVKIMAAKDLRAGDPLGGVISLICPHYQFWRSWARGRSVRHLAARPTDTLAPSVAGVGRITGRR